MKLENVRRHTADDVVLIARRWIGTPYHHQACRRGVGVDCLGLVRGVWDDLYGFEAEKPPAYLRDWAEASGEETMLKAARRHLVEHGVGRASVGDVLVFRYRSGCIAKHAGIMTENDAFVHAIEGRRVCEVALSSWWRRRVVAAFSFPGTVSVWQR